MLSACKGSQNASKSPSGASSAGPWQSGGEGLVSEKGRSSNSPWEARGCKFSSVIVRLRVGEEGKLSCCQQKGMWVRLHGRSNIITADVTSSGSDSDDEDSSEEMMYPTVFPGWGRSVAKDETAPSMSKDLLLSLVLVCSFSCPSWCSSFLAAHLLFENWVIPSALFQTHLPCHKRAPFRLCGLHIVKSTTFY